MIDRKYLCDLCRTALPLEKLTGISWTSNFKFEERPGRETEHHLCLNCLFCIAEIAKTKLKEEK